MMRYEILFGAKGDCLTGFAGGYYDGLEEVKDRKIRLERQEPGWAFEIHTIKKKDWQADRFGGDA